MSDSNLFPTQSYGKSNEFEKDYDRPPNMDGTSLKRQGAAVNSAPANTKKSRGDEYNAPNRRSPAGTGCATASRITVECRIVACERSNPSPWDRGFIASLRRQRRPVTSNQIARHRAQRQARWGATAILRKLRRGRAFFACRYPCPDRCAPGHAG